MQTVIRSECELKWIKLKIIEDGEGEELEEESEEESEEGTFQLSFKLLIL